MKTITLDDQDFGHLMFVLANAEGKGITWTLVNPLLMKIGDQLRVQSQPQPHPTPGDMLREAEKRAAELQGNGNGGSP